MAEVRKREPGRSDVSSCAMPQYGWAVDVRHSRRRKLRMQLFFDLDCGRFVAVDALYYQRTYLSLLEGRPNREMNDRILDKVRTEMAPLWGSRRVYVIPPEINESDPAHPVLPKMRFTAWLTCYKPIAEPNAGSELVVVWFREECPGEPLEKIVGDAIRSLPWEELAEDFEGW
jgi:hypothetical protein